MVRTRAGTAADAGLGDGQAGRFGWLVVRRRISPGRALLADPGPWPGAAARGGSARRALGWRRGGVLGAAAPAGHHAPRTRCAGRDAQLLAGRRVDQVLAGLWRPVGSVRRQSVAASRRAGACRRRRDLADQLRACRGQHRHPDPHSGAPDIGPADRRGGRGDRDRGRSCCLRAYPRLAGQPVRHDRDSPARRGAQRQAPGGRQPAAVRRPAPRPR